MIKGIKNYQIRVRDVLIVFAAVVLVIGAVCFQYYFELQNTIRDESRAYLQEISRRISSNVGGTINDRYAVIDTLEAFIASEKTSTFVDISTVVEAQQKGWNYKEMLLIDPNGVAYNSKGNKITLGGDDYFQNVILDKEASMSTSQIIDGVECIVFATPVEKIRFGGIDIVAIAVTYDLNTFDEIISMTSFDERAYSQVIKKDGTFIIRSSSPYASRTGDNVLDIIETYSTLNPNSSIDKLKSDILNDVSGQIGYCIDGVNKYMLYTPVEQGDWYLLTFVPIDVVNAKSDMFLKTTIFVCGAIALIFGGLIALLMYLFYRNRKRLEQIAYVDQVTGGNTIQKFYELAENALSAADHPPCVLVYTNLEKFKVLNEQFGQKICNHILTLFHDIVCVDLKEGECIGRIGADNFCILLRASNDKEFVNRLKVWKKIAEEYVLNENPVWSLPNVEFGAYLIENDTLSLPIMIDKAKVALRESPRTVDGRLRYAIYNDELRRRLFRDKSLEDRMAKSLSNGEFQIHLQPKYLLSTEAVGGAEALVRWVTEDEGMIFPDEFIPLFEKNGFIVQIDLFVFEQVCKTIQLWIENGITPVKVSVNCSRIHFKNIDFFSTYVEIFNKYSIPAEYIEIEFTESVAMDDAERFIKVISDVHEAGFSCSMDDFGSGYSSLNLIQSIAVDTMKIDRIFFKKNIGDPNRMWSVVSSIVGLAKNLNMDIVAEGVEYQDQVEELRCIGCDYIQGYVFSKPLPVADFEKLAFGETILRS